MTMPASLRLLSLSFLLALGACGVEEESSTLDAQDPALAEPDVESDAALGDPDVENDVESDVDEDVARETGGDAEADAEVSEDVCVPECDRMGCYDDGCGGTCVVCDDGFTCGDGGGCEPDCTPDCTEATCGDDGCGGTCGTCPGSEVCDGGVCECLPDCDEAECGDDGCGGSCGECADDDVCGAGACVSECTPDCGARICGSDSCEGSCGDCDEGDHCTEAGVCECLPSCEGTSCGDDGCGSPCGMCETGFECSEGDCVCVPDCGDRECGGDGCGGTCGECATECVEGACAPVAGCPPAAPYGTSVGDTVPDYTLTRCDGSTVTVHELCGNQANLLIGFAGWCPPCRANAPRWQTGVAERAGESFGAYFVINQDSSFAAPDATYCSGTAEAYGLTMPVLFDPTGGFASALSMATNDSTMVLGAELTILNKGQYESPTSVFATIDAILAE